MRVCVLGLGSIGMRHARNLRTLGITDLCGFDTDPVKREAFVATLGGRGYATLETALAASPALVVVASPNVFHLAQALAAARAGCHLFIEKPLGTDLAEAKALAALVGERRLYAHVGSNWKFHPAFVRMKALLVAGEIGRPTAAQVIAGQWLPDWHPEEDFRRSYSARADLGGGAVLDTHELDYLSWLLGPIDAISGMVAHSGALPIETEDVAACVVRFASGALGVVLTDYIQRARRRRYHISGDRGTIEWDFQDGLVQLHRGAGEAGQIYDATIFDLNAMYLEQMRRVLADIASGGRPETSLEHMIAVTGLQLAWRQGPDHGTPARARTAP